MKFIQTIKSIETEFAHIYLLRDDIGHVHFKPNVEINEDIQKELLEAYRQLTSKEIPFIYSSDEFLGATKDAPQHAKEIEAIAPITMKVLVVQNLAQRVLAGFYYKTYKPIHPYKVCSSFEDGIHWINSMRKSLSPTG